MPRDTENTSNELLTGPIASVTTDTGPPTGAATKLIVMAGAIKYWWLYKCPVCGTIYEQADATCTTANCSGSPEQLWDSPEHHAYLAWRTGLRAGLIDQGYLTYAPHEAFKGTWVESAQAVNDAAIAASDLMIVMSPEGIPTEGTDAEVIIAARVGTPVVYLPPELGISRAMERIAKALNLGQ